MAPISCVSEPLDALLQSRTAARNHRCCRCVCRAAQTDGADVGSVKAKMQSAENPWQISFQMNERCAFPNVGFAQSEGARPMLDKQNVSSRHGVFAS